MSEKDHCEASPQEFTSLPPPSMQPQEKQENQTTGGEDVTTFALDFNELETPEECLTDQLVEQSAIDFYADDIELEKIRAQEAYRQKMILKNLESGFMTPNGIQFSEELLSDSNPDAFESNNNYEMCPSIYQDPTTDG